jgi:hypothetical protein
MNIVQRHPGLALLAVAILTSIAHTMDYEDQLRIERQKSLRYIEQEQIGCRLPDPDSELRVILETRDEEGRLTRRCYIEPREDERPITTMKRLIARERTQL